MSTVKLQVLGRRRVHTVFVVGASVAVVSSTVDAPTVVLVKMELVSVDMETVELSVVDGSVVELISLPVFSGVLGAESYVSTIMLVSKMFASLGKVFEFFGHNQPFHVLRCLWLPL